MTTNPANANTFNLRIDKDLKQKGQAWAKSQGSDLSTEFRRWLIVQTQGFVAPAR